MKKRIAVWGGRLFQGVSYDKNLNKFQYISNNVINELSKKNSFDVDNFSMTNLDSTKALDYFTKALKYCSDYDYALIELGEEENDLDLLKENLVKMTDLAKEYGVKPILVTIPNVFNEQINSLVNNAIKNVSQEHNVKTLDVVSIINKQNELVMFENRINDAKIYQIIGKNIQKYLNN